jgi:hypothetical protein
MLSTADRKGKGINSYEFDSSLGGFVNAAVNYRIRVAGLLDPGWSEWFDGFTVTPQPNSETLIAGPVRDQAELNGLLNKLFSLNLVVIDVRRDGPEHLK